MNRIEHRKTREESPAKRRLRVGPAAMALIVMATPAFAHHSTAMYDRNNPVTVKGKVTEFAWVNPHAHVKFVADSGGETWVVEMTSPGALTRLGLTKRSLNPGDQIEMELQPLKTGGPAGLMMRVRNITKGQTFSVVP